MVTRAIAAAPGALASARRRWADRLELTKPRITALVLVTAGVGFYLASPAGALDVGLLLHTLLGTALLAGGTNALNQYAERGPDARMKRTRARPLPSGRMAPAAALAFAAAISAAGALYLALAVNPLTAILGALALAAYVFLYTPLKRRTWWCTLVGAVPGAIPPMMGWTAVRGELDVLAWVLFAIVFLWQLPHFYAIAWIYRSDYAAAGFPMLPVIDADGSRTSRQIVGYTAALVVVSSLTSVLGLTGAVYFAGSAALGALFLGAGLWAAARRSSVQARRLFLASVVYLPALLILMVVDKV